MTDKNKCSTDNADQKQPGAIASHLTFLRNFLFADEKTETFSNY